MRMHIEAESTRQPHDVYVRCDEIATIERRSGNNAATIITTVENMPNKS